MRRKSEDLNPSTIETSDVSILQELTAESLHLPAIRQLTEEEVIPQKIKKISTIIELLDFARQAFQDKSGKIKRSKSLKEGSKLRFYELHGQVYELPCTLLKANPHPLIDPQEKTNFYLTLDMPKDKLLNGGMSQVKKVINLESAAENIGSEREKTIAEVNNHYKQALVRKKVDFPALTKKIYDDIYINAQAIIEAKKALMRAEEQARGNRYDSNFIKAKNHLDALQEQENKFSKEDKDIVYKHYSGKKLIPNEIKVSTKLGVLTNHLQLHEKMYMFFPYLGEDFRDYLLKRHTEKYTFSLDEKLSLSVRVLGAVEALPIYHRDIKPRNLTINKQGSIQCIDFAFSRDKTHLPETEDSRQGTANYLPISSLDKTTSTLNRFALLRVLYMPQKIITAMRQRAPKFDLFPSIFTNVDIQKNPRLLYLDTTYEEIVIQDLPQERYHPQNLMRDLLQIRIDNKKVQIDSKYLDSVNKLLLINELLTNVIRSKECITSENIEDLMKKNAVLRLYAPTFLITYANLVKADTAKKFSLFKSFNTAADTLTMSFLEICEKAVRDQKRGKNSRTYQAFRATNLMNEEGKLIPEINDVLKLQKKSTPVITQKNFLGGP